MCAASPFLDAAFRGIRHASAIHHQHAQFLPPARRQRQSIRAFPEWQRGARRNPTRPSARALSLHTGAWMGAHSSSLACLMAAWGLAPRAACAFAVHMLIAACCSACSSEIACSCLVPGAWCLADCSPAQSARVTMLARIQHTSTDRRVSHYDYTRGTEMRASRRQGCLPYRAPAWVRVTEREPATSF